MEWGAIKTIHYCFIVSHVHLLTYWAKIWDKTGGFCVHHDIVALHTGACSLYLGHGGQPCPSKFSTDLIFCIVNANGIHNTRICFCSCNGLPNHANQLMKAQLFPATLTQPTTAFTFRVLWTMGFYMPYNTPGVRPLILHTLIMRHSSSTVTTSFHTTSPVAIASMLFNTSSLIHTFKTRPRFLGILII